MSNTTCPSESNIVLTFPRPPEGPKIDFGTFPGGSGDGLSRDSESTVKRSSLSTPVTPLNVQRNLSATGRMTGRIASEEFAAFVDAGVANPAARVIAPPANPRRPRVVRFNSVVDDS